MKKILTALLIFISFSSFTEVPVKKLTVSGYIKDKSNGEELISATVLIKEMNSGTVSNLYGFYSLSIDAGNYTLIFSYIGYQSIEKKIQLKEDITINIELAPSDQKLSEIEVTSEKKNVNITRNEMSVVKLQMQTIKKIPALMGEIDLIKAIQLLPGVQSTSEGSSGFSVRGGSSDQNLILLDEASVYNASHLMGFFSIFNNDAIKDVKLYKGDIPAANGGRLSSLLDVRMKEGNLKRFSGTGGIGTISSRLTLESPIIKDQTSFIVSGRRTYLDLFLPFSPNKDIRDNKLYFYDLNLKINHTLDENNRLFLSGYFGRDVFKNEFAYMGFGNQTLTFRWNHLISKRIFSNTSLIYSKYNYKLGSPAGEASSFLWTSNLTDYGFKSDFNLYLNTENSIRFGYHAIYHIFDPGRAKGVGENSMLNEYVLPMNYALEHGIYISNEQKVGSLLSLKYGLRYSLFQNIGKATIYNFDENYEAIDSTIYKSGDFFNNYSGFEPRLGLTYTITENSSIKSSYSRTFQYIHLAQNSTAGTPLDIWFPSSPNVKPQLADQIAIGYFRNFANNKIETSVEVYYKKMKHVIDFKDHAYLYLNDKLEGELRFGDATSYGAEFMIQLNYSKLSGWISYTYSHTERVVKEINSGDAYLAPYDKPHNVSVVLNYDFNKSISLGANWVYSSGIPVTFPTGRYEIGNIIGPVYSNRNEYRMPDYHRLDVSLTIKGNENVTKKWYGEWNFSIYNAYGRHNAWAINFTQDEINPDITYAEKTYLFTFVPAITYNFHF